MDNLKQVGKKLNKTAKETDQNTRRIAENFVKPERILGLFNKLHPYKTTFSMDDTSTAYLNLRFMELTVPCTINPPYLETKCSIQFDSDNPGFFREPFTSTKSIDPHLTDFTWTDKAVTVPLDGCYSVLWQSPAWGVGYFSNKAITVALLHNGYPFRTVVQSTTGVIALLGPGIYVYTPASPVYAVVECKAGDTLSAFLTQESIAQGYPWIGQGDLVEGGGLHGFFVDTDDHGATIQIELIAVAEE